MKVGRPPPNPAKKGVKNRINTCKSLIVGCGGPAEPGHRAQMRVIQFITLK